MGDRADSQVEASQDMPEPGDCHCSKDGFSGFLATTCSAEEAYSRKSFSITMGLLKSTMLVGN